MRETIPYDHDYARWQMQDDACLRAARSVILTPLHKRPAKNTDEIFRRHLEVIELRRRRLEALRDAGVETLQDSVRYQFIRNCPPVGMIPRLQGRNLKCHRSFFCSECWARDYVLDAFTRMERCLYGLKAAFDAGGSRKKPPPGVKLGSFLTRRFFVKGKDDDDFAATINRLLQAGRFSKPGFRFPGQIRSIIENDRLELNLHHPLVAYVLHRIDFVPDADTFILDRAGVFLTRVQVDEKVHGDYMAYWLAFDDRDECPPPTVQLHYHGAPTRAALIKSICNAFYYPAQMLLRPGLADVMAVFNGLNQGRLPMSCAYGPETHEEFLALLDNYHSQDQEMDILMARQVEMP